MNAERKLAVAGFVVDLERRLLLAADGHVVELRPQAFAVLQLLAERAGRLVTKDELLAAVWPGVVVTDDSLVQAVGDLRRALGEAGHHVVKTVPRRGYLLLGATVADAAPAPLPPPVAAPRRRGWLLAGVLACGAVLVAAAGAYVFGPGLAPPGSRPSIAVLPFQGTPAGADGDALARDVAAELVGELARSPDLRVVASQSSFQFAPAQTPLAEIGRRLRSRYVVDGTVRRDGEMLRIAVQLLDSESGHVVWSAAEDVDRARWGAAQRAFVGRIAGTLQARVSRSEERRALVQAPKTLDVFVLTAHGKAAMTRYDADGLREARRRFEQALAIDPDYAPAWAYLATTDMIDIGLRLTGEWGPARAGEMLAHVQRAIALDPELPAAYATLSQAQGLIGNVDAALAAAERCRKLSPNEWTCWLSLGAVQLRQGDSEAALRSLEQALDLNPVPAVHLPAFYGTALWASRRLPEALRVDDECLARAPGFWRCRQDRIATLVELGRLDEARAEAARLRAQVPGMTAEQFGWGFAASAAPVRERRVAAARAAGMPAAR
jgi:DNA-binding winged helix-turn-helix (wHTH) protein/TolB-like protein